MTDTDVYLRRMVESDMEKVMAWRMNHSVTKYMETDPALTMEGQLNWFRKISEDDSCRYFIMVADGIDIGVLGILDIDQKNGRCSWVWYIGEDGFRGHGIAKKVQLNLYDYVFEHLGMHRLYSHILTFNEHEIERVHKWAGYRIEGLMKDYVYKNGEYLDVTIMGITVDMWNEIKPEYSYEKVDFKE